MPQVDTQQDYELISLTEENGKTVMKIKRKFDTCDSQDNKIEVSWSRFTLFSFSLTQGLELERSFDAMFSCINKGFMYMYSCFEKGCLTKGEKLTRQCRKLLWVMVVFTVIEPQDVSTW